MTAHDFIAQIFSRPAYGLLSNARRITGPQLDLLRRLIGEDEEGGAVQKGMDGGFAWMPSGRDKYVITVDAGRDVRTLTRFANIRPSDAGRLF